MNRAFIYTTSLLVGAVTGFFLAGPLVFADGAMAERVLMLGVISGIYLGLGVVFGWWAGHYLGGLLLALPALPVALVLGEFGPFAGVTGLLLLSAGGLGGALGARLKARRKR